VLSWSHQEGDTGPTSGSIELGGSRVEIHDRSCEFKLVPSMLEAAKTRKIHECYQLRGLNEAEAQQWSSKIARSIQQLAWRETAQQSMMQSHSSENHPIEASSGPTPSEHTHVGLQRAPTHTSVFAAAEAAAVGEEVQAWSSSAAHQSESVESIYEQKKAEILTGQILLQAQGSQKWRQVFACARGSYLRYYFDEADCPYSELSSATAVSESPPNSAGTAATSERNIQVQGLNRLARNLSARGLVKATSSAVHLALRVDTKNPETNQMARDLQGVPTEDVVLGCVNIAEIEDKMKIKYDSETNQMSIFHPDKVLTFRAVVGSTETWHSQVLRLWDYHATLCEAQMLRAGHQLAVDPLLPVPKPAITQICRSESECTSHVQSFFSAAFESLSDQAATNWPEWIAACICPALQIAESELLDKLAEIIDQARPNRSNLVRHLTNAFGFEFSKLFQAFEEHTSDLSDVEGLSIIGWAKEYSQRLENIQISCDFDPYKTDFVKIILQNKHLPPASGYLKKRNSYGRWQRRYFVLTNGVLSYYQTRRMVMLHNSVPGEVISAVSREDQNITLAYSGKEVSLYANTTEEAEVWTSAIAKTQESTKELERLKTFKESVEVRAYDSHRDAALRLICKEVESEFARAEKLASVQATAAAKGSKFQAFQRCQAKRYMEATDGLIERLAHRMDLIPGDRPQVRKFYVLNHHKKICEHMEAIDGLPEWNIRQLFGFVTWVRQHDQRLQSMLGGDLATADMLMTQMEECWGDDIPGFILLQAPEFGGWANRRVGSSKWEKAYVIVKDFHLSWHTTPNEPPSGGVLITDAATITSRLQDGIFHIKVNTEDSSIFLRVADKDDFDTLYGSLSSSRSPQLPSEADVKADAVTPDFTPRRQRQVTVEVTEELSERAQVLFQAFSDHTHEELHSILSEKTMAQFRAQAETAESMADVLEVLSSLLEEFVDVVDEFILNDAATGEMVDTMIEVWHETIQTLVGRCCESGVVEGLESDCAVTVVVADISMLLQWIASYSSRIESLRTSTALHLTPWDTTYETPMADFMAESSAGLEKLLSNILPADYTVLRDETGKIRTSLPKDIFSIVYETTRVALASTCGPLVVNTVSGIVIPRIRVWQLSSYGTDGCTESDRLCAYINDCGTCIDLALSWVVDIEDQLETEVVFSQGQEDLVDQLNIYDLERGFKTIREDVMQELAKLIFGDVEGVLAGVSSKEWAEDNEIENVLETFADFFGDFEMWIDETQLSKLIESCLTVLVAGYVKQLLELEQDSASRKKASRGQPVQRNHADLSLFMITDMTVIAEFFSTYIMDKATLAALLQPIEIVANLHGCDLDDFLPNVQLAAGCFPDFSAEVVGKVLDAREDVDAALRRRVLSEASAEISVLLSLINTANEPESEPGPEPEQEAAETQAAGVLVPTLPEVGATSGVLSAVCTEPTRAMALYNFVAQNEGGLSFSAGDVLMVTETNGGWWKGYRAESVSRTSGVFPGNYVQVSDGGTPSMQLESHADAGTDLAGADEKVASMVVDLAKERAARAECEHKLAASEAEVQVLQQKLIEMEGQMEEQNVAFAETLQSLSGMLQN
jgi:hypothetical protein